MRARERIYRCMNRAIAVPYVTRPVKMIFCPPTVAAMIHFYTVLPVWVPVPNKNCLSVYFSLLEESESWPLCSQSVTHARAVPLAPLSPRLHAAIVAAAANMDADACQGKVLEDRSRVWETGAQLIFRVPDWTAGTVVQANVGNSIYGVQQCWNVVGEATLEKGWLEFVLADAGDAKDVRSGWNRWSWMELLEAAGTD